MVVARTSMSHYRFQFDSKNRNLEANFHSFQYSRFELFLVFLHDEDSIRSLSLSCRSCDVKKVELLKISIAGGSKVYRGRILVRFEKPLQNARGEMRYLAPDERAILLLVYLCPNTLMHWLLRSSCI